MQTHYTQTIIVGQGIAGTLLSWCMHQEKMDFIVIDNDFLNSPSKTAAGIINPVTGRRFATAWMDKMLLPFAENTYTKLGQFLNVEAIHKTSIIDFFPNQFMKENFMKRISQKDPYMSINNNDNNFNPIFNYQYGSGIIDPAYIVRLQSLLPAWRTHLQTQNQLLNSTFDFSKLEVSNHKIIYDNIEASKIIFCDGCHVAANPYFRSLPFAFNKGEALIIEALDLPSDYIYKKTMSLVPFGKKGIFWMGTNHIWNYENALPTQAFEHLATAVLQSWLKVSFKIIDHKAALRPATINRRPFVGFHPIYKNVGILNGMGTKACSLAPYFAHQLVKNILHTTEIEKEADIARHSEVLSKVVLN